MSDCPCGSLIAFDACCGPYLSAKQTPKTPLALMRSRYTAYTRADIDYIKKTMRAKALAGFDEMDAKRWAMSVQWLGLEIIAAPAVAKNKTRGVVEFVAKYRDLGVLKTIHERSQFKAINGVWYYVGVTTGVE